MERTKGRPLASPIMPSVKPDAPKLRKRLQKNVGKLRVQQTTKRVSVVVPNEPATDTKLETARKCSTEKPTQPPPPDLSDSKWAQYVRASGYVSNLRPLSQSKETPKPPKLPPSPLNIIPELSHLAISDSSPSSSPRLSNDSLTPHSPASSTSTMRRLRAKTPVFAIGQLEAERLKRPANALASDKRSSVEILAEQYRALLQSRNSIFTDSHSEPPPSRDEDSRLAESNRYSAGPLGDDGQLRRASADLSHGSPTSDDGTLVSFEEDAIYFKPISFSPEPSSPFVPHFQSPIASPTPAPDNLSLQICMDLLTRDLSSSIASRPSQASPEATALQIWVMIEAYERLRDQLYDMRLPYEDKRPLEQMFDMWLRSLYSIHDSLNDQSRQCESDYESLETEELD